MLGLLVVLASIAPRLFEVQRPAHNECVGRDFEIQIAPLILDIDHRKSSVGDRSSNATMVCIRLGLTVSTCFPHTVLGKLALTEKAT